jgi:hypothetical protein
MSPSTRLPTSFHVVVPVWGEQTIRVFTELALPSMLAPGNIPTLAGQVPVVMTLFTRKVDVSTFEDNPTIKTLRSVVEVRFQEIDNLIDMGKHAAIVACHKQVLGDARTENQAVVFLDAESMWSDGSLTTVVTAIESGKRAVMQEGLCITKEAIAQLWWRHGRPRGETISIAGRDLVRTGFEFLHPNSSKLFWGTTEFVPNPEKAYWRTSPDSTYVRAFRLTPLMIFPKHQQPDSTSEYPRYECCHVVADSDEAFHVNWGNDDQPDLLQQIQIARMYEEGLGVEQDLMEAVRWYRLAAEQGDFPSQAKLGEMHDWNANRTGDGIGEDCAEAPWWFRLSAGQGDSISRANIGRLYKEGRGVKKDLAEAARWYRLAEESKTETDTAVRSSPLWMAARDANHRRFFMTPISIHANGRGPRVSRPVWQSWVVAAQLWLEWEYQWLRLSVLGRLVLRGFLRLSTGSGRNLLVS